MIGLALLAATAATPPIALRFPVACRLGETCIVQNYPDDDPGPAARDHACGERTYDAHNGTDIRLQSMVLQRAGVAVIAAAAGTVLRTRDGVDDISADERPFAPGTDCGNGLVVDDGGGWETQYCHMAKGSIAVKPGQPIAAGAVLGKVGLSGNTVFPHLHLTVRKDGVAVDPFAWGAAPKQCGGGRSLWAQPIAYQRGAVLVTGFSTGPVTARQVQDAGSAVGERPGRETALVAYVLAAGLEGGDRQRLTLSAPDGRVLATNEVPPLDRAKAQYVAFTGRGRQAQLWAAGTYRADYRVERGGRVVLSRQFEIRL